MQNACDGSPMELELPPDFKEFFKSLNSNKVKYLLIGGYAVIIHGYSRNTADLDVVVLNDAENAVRCVKALREFGFATKELNEKLFASEEKNLVKMGIAPVKIEILNYLEGADVREAYERRVRKRVEDIELDVISLQDLIANKNKVGRLQDLTDVQKLKERNNLN